MGSSRLTHFVARYVAGSLADCLCFGDPVNEYELGGGQTSYHFRPGQVFCIVWWRRYAENRQHRALAVVEAIGPNTRGQALPSIDCPVAVHAIVDQHGPAGQDGAVDQFIDLIAALKQSGQNPSAIPPIYWTDAAQQILLDQTLSERSAEEPAECPV